MTEKADAASLFAPDRLTIIAGPCVIESDAMCRALAADLVERAARHRVRFVFKASFDKANRTALESFRGPGIERGLETLARVRHELNVPVLTDIHEPWQAERAAGVVDALQIPAFLCRQTDLIVAAAKTGLPTNLKKGQFLAPEDMAHAVHKHQASGGGPVSVTERGASFGYHTLVVDMRGLVVLRETTGVPVIFDATHSVQAPCANDGSTGGERRFAPVLARAAAAVGVDGVFCEVHPDPARALSDGPNALSPEQFDQLLEQVVAIDAARRQTT
ncbi:MAG: 3-deoxy-8-phosphooctulonate synthase [Deltaproteobacteria bacterium]|nr:3-deoxy-8-phosphooctulonate synthase [Deltaproteobacteria bacterium]